MNLFFCFILLYSFIPANVYGIKMKQSHVIPKPQVNETSITNVPKIMVRRRMTEICVNLTQFTLFKQFLISEMLKEPVHQILNKEDNRNGVQNPSTYQWQKPKFMNCGVKYLYIKSPLTASYYCDSDVLVSDYSLKTDKQDLSTPTIAIESNTGKLVFTNYFLYPSIVITITASNPMGDVSYNITVIIQTNTNHRRGLHFNITSKEEFSCLDGPESSGSYESQAEYSGIIENIDSLSSHNGFMLRFPFIDTRFIRHFKINFNGLFYAATCGYYTFYSQADQGTKMSLDGKEIIYNYQICDGYDHIFKKLVYLAQGYHQIEITYYKGSESNDWKFSYTYTLPNSIQQLPLPLYYITEENEPVIKLKLSKLDHTLIKNYFYKIPFKFEQGDANRCYTYPNLPTGLYIHDNCIMGVATEVMERKIFGVMCENSNSITNMVHFTLEVTDDKTVFKKGVVLSILKPNNDEDESFLLEDNRNIAKVYYTFYLKDVNIPLTTPWFGISDKFTKDFIMRISSYIYVPKNGNYILKLKTSSYVFLYINNILYILHNKKSDVEEYTTISLKNDYYYYELVFSHDDGNTVLNLEWKHEDDVNYVNYFDNSYSNAFGDLYYKYYLYTYKVNKEITSPNEIVDENPSQFNSFTVYPELPDGITIDSTTGKISGKPLSYQNEFIRFYSVTAKDTANDKTMDIPITLSVHKDSISSIIKIVNEETGENFTNSITLFKGSYVTLSIQSVDGSINSIEILSAIPKGLSFNATENKITGLVRSDLTPLLLYIRGYTNDDYVDFSFPIILKSNCSETMNMHRYVFRHVVDKVYDPSYQKIIFTLYHNDIELRKEEIDPNVEVSSIPQCYPKTVYKHSVDVGIDVPVVMDLFVDGILSYSYTFEAFSQPITFDTNPTLPIFSYSSDYFVYSVNKNIEIKPIVKGYIEKFIVKPNHFPDDIHFDQSFGIIYGTFLSILQRNYTIAAVNDVGVSLPFTIELRSTIQEDTVSCLKRNLKPISIVVAAADNGNCMSYTFKSKENIIESFIPTENNKKYIKNYCIEEGDYELVLAKKNCDTWGKGYIAYSSYDSFEYTFFMKRTDSVEETHILHLYDLMNQNTEFEYSYNYEDGWNDYNFIHSWEIDKLKNLFTIPYDKHLYLRTSLDINSTSSIFSSSFINIVTEYDFILYINGKILYNKTTVNKDIKTYTNTTNIVVPMYLLGNDFTLVAIELFSNPIRPVLLPSSQNIFINFRGEYYDKTPYCTSLNGFGGYLVESSDYSDDVIAGKSNNYYDIEKYGFDNNPETTWEEEYPINGPYNLYGWVVYSFGLFSHFYINRITITNSNSTNEKSYVKDVSFEGNNNENEWIKFAEFTDIQWDSQGEVKDFHLEDTKYYNRIRVNITQIQDYGPTNNIMSVSDINFWICKDSHCKSADNILPDGDPDQIETINCPNSQTGLRKFICKDKMWNEIENNCNMSPQLLNSMKSVEIIVGIPIKSVLASFSCSDCEYSISPSLPEGLSINNTTGEISGNVNDLYESKEYTITAKNRGGEISVNTMFVFRYHSLPSITAINDSIELITGEKYEDEKIIIAYGNDISYSINPNLPSGLYLDNAIGTLSGVATESSSGVYKIIVQNSNGTVSVSITISVVLCEYPTLVSQVENYNFIMAEDYENESLFVATGKSLTYSIVDDLPPGLTIDSDTGFISGKPTSLSQPKPIKFVVSNSYSSVYVTVNIGVIEPDYPILIQQEDSITISIGKVYNNYNFYKVIGPNINYRLIPDDLPEGLIFSDKNGTISGYILNLPKETTKRYSVIAMNSLKTIRLMFTLKYEYEQKPFVVREIIKNNTITYYKGVEVPKHILFPACGSNIRYSVALALPKGLLFNTSNGEISGIPLEESPMTLYVLTIQNNYFADRYDFILGVKVLYCPEDRGFPLTEMNTTRVLECASTHSGSKTRTCLMNKNNEPEWGFLADECHISILIVVVTVVASTLVGIVLLVLLIIGLSKWNERLLGEKNRKKRKNKKPKSTAASTSTTPTRMKSNNGNTATNNTTLTYPSSSHSNENERTENIERTVNSVSSVNSTAESEETI